MKKLSFLISLTLFGLAAIGQSCTVNFSSYVYADSSIHAYASTSGTDSTSVYAWYVISQGNDTLYQQSSEATYMITPRLTPGVYSICLAVYNGGSLCGDACKINADTIPPPCSVSSDFTIVYQSGDSVEFLAADTNDLRYWYYGDSTNSYQLCTCHPAEPVHVYTGPGTYQVCLESYTSGTCGDTICQNITISPTAADSCLGLSADWLPTRQSGDTVQFSAPDTASNDRRYWVYGDGTNSYGACECFPVDPVHIYPGPGTYQACLYNYRPGYLCGTDSFCRTITITAPAADSCAGLSAYWLPTRQSGDTVQFSATDTVSNDHRYWVYGDGTTSYGACSCFPVDPVHVFPGPGTYQVCLYNYRPGFNCGVDSFCRTITISAPAADSCEGLSAYWLPTHQSGDTVGFLASDTFSNDHRYWYYGDGTNSYTICTCHPVDPVHVYPGPGTYQACLYVYRPGYNCGEDSFCRTITIAGPAADSCAGLSSNWYVLRQSGDTVQFLAADTFSNDHRYWYYGDGTNSYSICGCHPVDPIHIFPGPGTYQVCIYNYRPGFNCPSDSICQDIVIAPHDTNSACANLSLSWNYNISGDTLNFHFCFYSATSNCNDSLCQDISVISSLILHLDEISGGNNDIQLFPNPFSQYTTIHINESTPPPFSLVIYDTDGNEVRQQIMNANQFNVDRGSLASGMYLFRILKDGQVIGKGRMIAN